MTDTSNREMRISRILKAPVDVVWEVWSNPEHIAHWWGPDGFTTTIHKMDFKEGGKWHLTLHGPDGTNYPNHSVFTKIVPLKEIVYEHSNPHFVSTIVFEDLGTETRMEWIGVFDSPEMYEIIVKTHKADEGQKQNVAKLEQYLATHKTV